MSICTQNSNINEKRAQYPSYDQWKHMEMSQENDSIVELSNWEGIEPSSVLLLS